MTSGSVAEDANLRKINEIILKDWREENQIWIPEPSYYTFVMGFIHFLISEN